MIGGYTMGWAADKIGRRKALMISAVLAAAFSWPFAYVTNYPALVVLSIFTGLGCGGALAINVVYISEMTGPAVRGRVTMGAQVLAIIMLETVLIGWIPHFMIPGHYKAFQWLLTGINLLIVLPCWPGGCTNRRAGWSPGRNSTRPARSWSGWKRGS